MNALQRWHDVVSDGDTAALAEILAENCIFYSPVVHTPQRGREITQRYLAAAVHVFKDGGFRYLKEVADRHHAMLEFTCTVDDIEVNGIDILSFDSDGLMCEFKVMVRPLKAVNILHAKMAAMLAQPQSHRTQGQGVSAD